jgi:hypothetical protein
LANAITWNLSKTTWALGRFSRTPFPSAFQSPNLNTVLSNCGTDPFSFQFSFPVYDPFPV